MLCQAIRDLACKALLRLQAPRKEIDDPGQLGEADNAFARWHIGDMGRAEECREVMLAMRQDYYVAFDYHLIVIGMSAHECNQMILFVNMRLRIE
jgi:hypothetical protein